MIGSAIVRESRLAWSREKRRQRAAARVTPLRETPGASAAAWAMPSASPSAGSPRRARAAAAGCRRRASPPPRRAGRRRSPAARPAAARSAARACSRRSPPAGRRGRGASARAAVELRAAPRRSVRRWPISSAAAAPACSATSKLLRSSGSIASQSQPASQGTRTMWAELETGSSSAGPWTMPSASARRELPAGLAQAPLGRRLGSARSRPRPPPRRRISR